MFEAKSKSIYNLFLLSVPFATSTMSDSLFPKGSVFNRELLVSYPEAIWSANEILVKGLSIPLIFI